QRTYLEGEVLERKIAYWKQKLTGVSPLELPTDHIRPAIQSTRGSIVWFNIDKQLTDALKALSQQEGVTLYMTLLAAFKLLLYRYTGQHDICVGTPVAGRQQKETEVLIGLFLNSLALRTRLDNEQTFIDLLQQVRTTTLEAYEHQDAPFEKVVEAVVKDRDLSRSPLFQVLFILQNTPALTELKLGDIVLEQEGSGRTSTQFEINLSLTETASGLNAGVEYCTDLFEQETIARLADHYVELLKSVARSPRENIASMNMLTATERKQLLNAFNDTGSEYPKDKTFIDLFEEQVERTPGAVAVVFGDQQLTYRELNKRSNKMAHYLRAQGTREDDLVVICLHRGFEMMTALLGVLKAGAAYVPVDPSYPAERIAYMLEDTGVPVVITGSNIQLPSFENKKIIYIDKGWSVINKGPESRPVTALRPFNLAYVIYTSGSTGKPKGVMIEHRSLLNFLCAMSAKLGPSSESSLLAVTTYCFDIAYLELYLLLLWGGRVIISSREEAADGYLLMQQIAKHRPSYLQATPSAWQMLLDAGWQNVEGVEILAGGEAMKDKLKDQLVQLSNKKVWNLYGPTEATIWASIKELHVHEKVNIGRPLHNTRIYILDEQGMLLPTGCIGEIYIGGDCLARGYLNRPALTKEKFLDDPFNAGERLYRTGDLGRWLNNGEVEYLGRIDQQVKIRGHRIELGEIENVLQQSEFVSQSVVLAQEDKEGHKRLVAYIVSRGRFDHTGIITYLEQKLPDYMVPGILIQMESLPLTANGKTDRKALAGIQAAASLSTAYVAPRTQTEELLVDIWHNLLGDVRIGINDSFFELGGHSLLAMRMISYLKKTFDLNISIRVLFQLRRISELAEYIEMLQATRNIQSEEDSQVFEI
ncbi:MAG TPA: amino acid adenylation domain-containing protein, partial [Chitinophagaceae bacterium]|nr:amino acid adenylation domain-containing protein [Chitinophagaceae bacterium]